MRLTTKGRYAVTAMVHMALHGQVNAVRLAEIAQQQDISLSYLEQLFAKLRAAGLVVSARGPGGGYRLAAAPAEISAAAIIDAVNESTDATHCGGEGNCQGGEVCLTHFLWTDLNSVVRGFLSRVTLAELVGRPEVRAVAARQQAVQDTIAIGR